MLATLSRRQRNNIDYLKLGDGTWSSNREEIKADIIGFYQNLYTSSDPTTDGICNLKLLPPWPNIS